ncbi:MAG TPA: CRISPR-associated helicase Cas3', partial [Trueperaceae bacterium]
HERLRAQGLDPVSVRRTVSHGFISAYFIRNLLPEWGLSRESAVGVAHAVGGHHGRFPDPDSMDYAEDHLGGPLWREAQRDLTAVLAHVLDIPHLPVPDVNLLADSAFLIRLAGLTSVADWIGSNHTYFPFVGDAFTLPEYSERARDQALEALQDLGWFHRPEQVDTRPFVDLFDHIPNALQQQVEAIAGQLKGPSLVVLEYPMGGGKTEAALYLANALHAQAGHQGMYVALPTMATSNQIFRRVQEHLARCFPGHTINLQLLHGRADLNPNFARLIERGQALPDAPVVGDGLDAEANIVAAEWFTQKKQALLAPFGVGTVDQALLAALDTRHYFVRLFGLAGKVVILDEVHAYDVYMQTLLNHLLTWLAACGSSVVLLSATLPRQTRTGLMGAFARGLGVKVNQATMSSPPYPRISWLTTDGVCAVSIKATETHNNVCLQRFDASDDQWMAALCDRLHAGGCAAVLCNTVTRAQQTYRSLQRYFTDDELMIFHARYPFDDRMKIEMAVTERFGRDGHARPHRMVCVATQVIEQSLDIDFDLMVSELAPVDLILQRSGRIWRHHRENRPCQGRGPELWLLLPKVTPEGVPRFDRATAFIYDEHLLLRSYLVLKDLGKLTVPAGVEDLIERVYSPADPPEWASAELRTAWQQTAERMYQGDVRDRRQARIREIPDLSTEIIDYDPIALEEDAPDVHVAHQGMTRLGGPSVEVICLYERRGQLFYTLETDQPVVLDRRPSPGDIQALLGRSLRISFNPGLVKRILEESVPASWQATPHLRRHRLLRFAPDGTCLADGIPLRLDPVLGLCVERPEMEVER